MDLSVIIVNWNTKKLLDDCLSSIFKFTKDIDFEVIVIDNDSKDGSPELVKKKYSKVKLIENKDNVGYAKANNQGIKVAKGEYILLLNSDTYLIENSFEKLVEKVQTEQNLGVLAPLLLNVDRSTQQSAGYFPHLPQVFFWMTFLDDLPGGTLLKPYHLDHNWFYRKDHEVDWITGAAFLIPKKVIDDVGTLDESIFMYGEDVDWCYRIKKSGFKVIYSPVTKIVHIGRGSSGQISKNAIIGEFKGIKIFYQKHKGSTSLLFLRLFLKIGALARIVIFSLLCRRETAKFYAESLKMA